jgi:hypothetical protein
MSSLCKCGAIREKRTASPSAKFPGRQYFKCQCCDAFDWADSPTKLFNTVTGPECKCGKSSVQRTVKEENNPNKGRKFWCCAKGRGNGSCGFFEFCDDDKDGVVRKLNFETATKRPALPGYATYLSDWKKLEVVQNMMAVDPDLMKGYTGSRYDDIDIVGLWQIGNDVQREKYDAAKERIKKESPKESEYDIPQSYQDQMNQLSNKSLDADAGECFLLHGTRPENLHGILFEGHDTALANNGNFGRGIYFAENAAKIDQYSSKDDRYQKGDGNVAQLHEKIYTQCLHPNNVRYALVCRVLLGRHIRTSNGTTRLEDGKPAFTNKEQNELVSLTDGTMPSSLIGVPGELVRTFREFVVFNSDQVYVEYLVAYKRVRSNCHCGKKCMEKTVVKETENRGRKIHLCADDKCGFMQMLPLCDCGDSATVKTSNSKKNPGKRYYSCHQRFGRGRCNFFEWKEGGSYTNAGTNPNKRSKFSP